MSLIELKDPAEVDACLGGMYSSCAYSPLTHTSVYAGSVENQFFFVYDVAGGWMNIRFQNRCCVSIDGAINSVAISFDGSVSACALAPSDEGSELYIIRTPAAGAAAPTCIKIFESAMFPIRSICFGMGSKLKTKLFVGTDEGRVFGVSIGRKNEAQIEYKNTHEVSHGGVKCVASCPLTGNIAVSYCDGFVVLFDHQTHTETESRKISKKNSTPDSLDKFSIAWNPQPKRRELAIAGLAVPVVLKTGVWATTPLSATDVCVDGNLSTVAWALDGTMIAGITTSGSVSIFDYSPITGPVLKIRAVSKNNTLMSLFWSYSDESHVVNAIGLKGVRTSVSSKSSVEASDLLTKPLKIDLTNCESLDSGLVEEAVDDDVEEAADGGSSESSSDSDDSEKAESVDESPEQLREELEDLVGKPVEAVKQDAANDVDEDVDNSVEPGGQHLVRGDRQFSFQPGASTSGSTGRSGMVRRLLCWNQFGSVVRIDGPEDSGSIEVRLELDDNKNFRLKDSLHGWQMAALSNQGLALAVKSRFDLTDKYEDDLVANNAAADDSSALTGGLSKVCFRPFNSWGNEREWIVPLPNKSEVESVAAGSTTVAAISSDSTVRIWSAEGGFLIHQFCCVCEVPISLASFGDLYFAVSTMRSRSTETMSFQTFTVVGSKLSMLSSGPLPISGASGSLLCWVGISEEFVPFTCDTLGVIRGLFPTDNGAFVWSPLLNFVTNVQKHGEGYWPLFVSDKDMWCVPTRAEDDYEPRTAPLPAKISVALQSQAEYQGQGESGLFVERLLVHQAKWVESIALVQTHTDKAKKMENLHDKKLAETYRKLLEAGRLEKALGSAALGFGSITSRLMIRMAAALGLRTLESRLEDLFNGVPTNTTVTSAASRLFPNASTHKQNASKQTPMGPPITTPAQGEIQQSTPPTAPPQVESVMVNPFAKKRKETELNDENNENKLPRNA